MNIDLVLMGHTSREKYHQQMVDDLCRYEMKASIDDGTLGVWENAKQAWQLVDERSDYGIVIQDDALLCKNFILRASLFLSKHRGQIVSFYFGDDPNNERWIKPDFFDAPLFHAVCLAIPTYLIDDMIAYCDQRPEVYGDDMKMKRWLISKNKTCRYSNPSLVQHRDIPSIVDTTKPTRQSAIYESSQ